MRAAIFEGPGKLEIKDLTLQKLEKKDLRIQIGLCGLCGTDFHIFAGEAPSKPPVIPGHEFVGTVVETGSDVTGVKIGDRVAVDPNIYCGECNYCRTGNIQFCSNLKALGVTLNGGFAEYSIVPSGQAYLIPKDFPFSIASFAEPLSCCVHGIDQAAVKAGQSVAIVGAGTIGLLMLQLVKISGAGKIIVIEPVAGKREIASRLGANFTFDPNSPEMNLQISELTAGGPDVIIECAGNQTAAQTALSLTKKGGKIVIFGLAGKEDTLKINLQDFFHREITLKSSLLNPFTFSRSVELLVSGKIDVEVLNPELKSINDLPGVLNRPRNYSVTKYQITPN